MSTRPDPAAHCEDCDAVWHSDLLVEGLRLLRTCPRCGTGTVVYRDAAPVAAAVPDAAPTPVRATAAGLEPHLVLGRPRL